MNWQPISSAPKDKRVLVWTGQDIYAAQWAKNPYTDEEAWVVGRFWVVGGEEDDQLILKNPTHWQPLPEEPKD